MASVSFDRIDAKKAEFEEAEKREDQRERALSLQAYADVVKRQLDGQDFSERDAGIVASVAAFTGIALNADQLQSDLRVIQQYERLSSLRAQIDELEVTEKDLRKKRKEMQKRHRQQREEMERKYQSAVVRAGDARRASYELSHLAGRVAHLFDTTNEPMWRADDA